MTERTYEQVADEIRDRLGELYAFAAAEDGDPGLAAPTVTGYIISAAITGFNDDGEVAEDGHVTLDGSHLLALGCAHNAVDYLTNREGKG